MFAAGERVLVFTHFAEWGVKLAEHLTERTGTPVDCYHGGLSRTRARPDDRRVPGRRRCRARSVLSLKAGGTGLNLTAANHVVLYDRWWNPAVEDQARDRAWRIGQTHTVICHRLVCPGTVDERVEEVVAGKRRIADLVLPKSSSLADLDTRPARAGARHPLRGRAAHRGGSEHDEPAARDGVRVARQADGGSSCATSGATTISLGDDEPSGAEITPQRGPDRAGRVARSAAVPRRGAGAPLLPGGVRARPQVWPSPSPPPPACSRCRPSATTTRTAKSSPPDHARGSPHAVDFGSDWRA